MSADLHSPESRDLKAESRRSARVRRPGAAARPAEPAKPLTELEMIDRLGDAIGQCDDEEGIFQRLDEAMLASVGLRSVAIFDQLSGKVLRAGCASTPISDEVLRQIAQGREGYSDPLQSVYIVPVREAGHPAGSAGVVGAGQVSTLALKTLAVKVGHATVRVRAGERVMEAEIAKRTEELKSALLDALAHEARGPLGSITLAASTLLSERPGDAEQRKELLQIILEEAARMRRWLDETARVSRAEARRLPLDLAARNVSVMVAAAVEGFGAALQGRPTVIDIPAELPLALCDREMVVRILKLLLDNAIKYSPAGAPVFLSAALEDGAIVMAVEDEGPGVPEEEQFRIFEKHYRGAAFRGDVPGTGLGLASAKSMVDAQGGAIWVEDRAGGGASFRFTLPVAVGEVE